MNYFLRYIFFFITVTSFAQFPGGVSNNCVLWVKADDLNLNTGDNVTLWNDACGLGNDANQPVVNLQPTYNEEVQNYNSGIYFNESNQYLDLPNLIAPNSTTLNIFAIGTNEVGSNNGEFHAMVFGQGENQWSSGGYCLCSTNNSQTGFGFWTNTFLTRAETPWFGVSGMPSRILEGKYDGTDITFYLDAQNRQQTPYNGIVGIGGTGSGTTHLGGGDRTSNSHKGHISEVIIYSDALSNTDRNKINSYLTIKYGITGISRGGIANNIVDSNGQSLFVGTTNEYWHGILGIGRDDTSALHQKQSHTNTDDTRIYIANLATTNSANSGNFNNNQFVIMGHNDGILSPLTNIPSTELPPTVITRIDREYKITNTSFTNTFNVDIELNDCVDITQIDINDIRLLIDSDGDFTNANVYADGDNGLSIIIDGDFIKFLNISNTHIANNSTAYITIASTTIESLNLVLIANDIADLVICDALTDGFENFPIDITSLENQIIGSQTDIDSVNFFDESGAPLILTNPYTNVIQNIQTITARITHDIGCYAETTFNLVALTFPNVAIQPDIIECSGAELPAISGTNLSGNQAYYTAPNGPNGGGNFYLGGDILNFDPLETYPITMYIYDGVAGTTCFSETNFQLTVVVKPEVDDLNDVIVCGTYTLPTITGTNLTGSEAYFAQPNGPGSPFFEGHVFNYGDISNYPFTLYIYSTTGTLPICTDEENFDLTIFNSVDFELTETNLDIDFIGNMTVNMTDDSVNYEYAVDNLNYQTDNTFTNLEEGIHTLFVRDENGCITKNINFEIVIIYSIIPKFFTPNGDGTNDNWKVVDNLHTMTSIRIFDRYGKVIANILPNTEGWNGNYKGKKLLTTDYWYVIDFNTGKQIRGHFSLIN